MSAGGESSHLFIPLSLFNSYRKPLIYFLTASCAGECLPHITSTGSLNYERNTDMSSEPPSGSAPVVMSVVRVTLLFLTLLINTSELLDVALCIFNLNNIGHLI